MVCRAELCFLGVVLGSCVFYRTGCRGSAIEHCSDVLVIGGITGKDYAEDPDIEKIGLAGILGLLLNLISPQEKE